MFWPELFALQKEGTPSASCLAAIVDCLQSGNEAYDTADLHGAFTSIYTALDFPPGRSFRIAQQSGRGIRKESDCIYIFDKVAATASAEGCSYAGVSVHHPVNLTVVLLPNGSAFDFDSHSHLSEL